jgi:hypothetical protein
MTRAGSVPGSSPNSKDYRGVDLISDVLPFGRLWFAEPNAVSNANIGRPGLFWPSFSERHS